MPFWGAYPNFDWPTYGYNSQFYAFMGPLFEFFPKIFFLKKIFVLS